MKKIINKLFQNFKPIKTHNEKYKEIAKKLSLLKIITIIYFTTTILIIISNINTQKITFNESATLTIITAIYIVCILLIKIGEIIIISNDNDTKN